MAAAIKTTKEENQIILAGLALLSASHDRKAHMKGVDKDIEAMYKKKADEVDALYSKINQKELEL